MLFCLAISFCWIHNFCEHSLFFIVHVRLLNHSFVNIFLFNPVVVLWIQLNLLFTYVWKLINLIWQFFFFIIIIILCIVIYCLFLSCRSLDMGIFIQGWWLGFQFLGFSTHLEHYGSGWLVTGYGFDPLRFLDLIYFQVGFF
jgi:hypothetical protein